MADHFSLMVGRLLTESTLQSAMEEAFAAASVKIVHEQPDPSVHEDVQEGKPKSGVIVECRICQEEGDESGGALAPGQGLGADATTYAHHACIQRWCNEKGDTMCEICLQQFTPNYTAPLKLFRHGRNPINFRRSGERSDNTDQSQEHFDQTSDQTAGASSFDSQNSSTKGVFYCRVVAISLMVLLVLRDAISLILGDPEAYSMALLTLLMIRTAGIVIPIYIILISVTALFHRYRQHQTVHEAPISETGGEGVHPMPPPQHVISIR
uniref:RING-CH-type domain-containing protein n=1 Tax=Leersia perrieri TaxID=77586 RepID=A0A0D9V493_9ORYZ